MFLSITTLPVCSCLTVLRVTLVTKNSTNYRGKTVLLTFCAYALNKESLLDATRSIVATLQTTLFIYLISLSVIHSSVGNSDLNLPVRYCGFIGLDAHTVTLYSLSSLLVIIKFDETSRQLCRGLRL